MSRQDNNRVLVRKGARELTMDEIDQVSAAMQNHTNVCTAIMPSLRLQVPAMATAAATLTETLISFNKSGRPMPADGRPGHPF